MIENKTSWLKYFAPFVGILFCPVTVLFLWSFWSAPIIESEVNFVEETQP